MERQINFFNKSKVNTISSFSTNSPSNIGYEFSTSAFVEHKQIMNELFINQFRTFEKTMNKRIDYLESLSSLGDNWISGNSKKPNRSVVNNSKKIVSEFVVYLKRMASKSLESTNSSVDCSYDSTDVYDVKPKIPKVIMGPIPTGGICLEFHADQSTALFITLKNQEEKIDLEVKIKDFYSDLQLDNKNFRDLFNGYTALSWN